MVAKKELVVDAEGSWIRAYSTEVTVLSEHGDHRLLVPRLIACEANTDLCKATICMDFYNLGTVGDWATSQPCPEP
eukprot:4373-Heterococcus_DN1.PRE.2